MEELEAIKQNSDLIKKLYLYVKKQLQFPVDASLTFLINNKNAANPLGKTAYYSPEEKKVSVYITNRHIKDIMRSLAHELVHHSQNCRGEFNDVQPQTAQYAQQDQHLREMEREAYEVGNMMFRDWEDQMKTQIQQNEEE
jgi:hypothetical protein